MKTRVIHDIGFQFLLGILLFLALTGGSVFIGWENLKPHPDLKRVILMLLAASVAGLSYWRYKKDSESFFNLEPVRTIKAFFELPALWSVSLVFLLYWATQVASLFFAQNGLETALWDLGFYDQVIWNGARNGSLWTSVRGGLHVFAEHFKPILLFLTPIYWWNESIHLLFVVAAFVSGTSLIAVYLIAKHVLKSHVSGLVFMLCIFFYLPLRNGINFPFHSQTFADPFILFGLYCVLTKKNKLAMTCFVLALLCKENIVLDVLGIGLFLIARRERLGWFVTALALSTFALVFMYIEPHFRYPFHFVNKWSFYAHFHTTDLEVWKRLLEPSPITFLYLVFGPFLFVSLKCRHWFWLLAPSFSIRILSNYSGLRLMTAHYTAGVNALVIISAIFGAAALINDGFPKWMNKAKWEKLLSFIRERSVLLSLLLLAAVCFTGFPQMFKIDKHMTYTSQPHYQRAVELCRTIPAEYSVMASERLAPHLSHRKYLYAFYEMFPYTPLVEPSSAPDLVILDEERMGREMKAIHEFVERGYERVVKIDFVSVFASPELKTKISPELIKQWNEIRDLEIIPYRTAFQSWYMKFALGILLLFSLFACRPSRFKKNTKS